MTMTKRRPYWQGELMLRTDVAVQMATSFIASDRWDDAYNVLAAYVDGCRKDAVNTDTDPGSD